MAGLKAAIASGVRRALGQSETDLSAYETPHGDPGLFGPESMAWEVHSDLPSMLIGGFSALLYQMLHPLAMAGVADHSSYRSDPLGRLRRTAQFVAGTTYGPTALAESLIARVQAVHREVVGTAPDGRAYSALDPALVTFVHTTEVDSFLRSHQRYSRRPLLAHEKDAYFFEVGEIATRLGASEVPRSLSEVRSYLRDVRTELSVGRQAREAFAFLLKPSTGQVTDVVAHQLIMRAAVDLLPSHAKSLFGVTSSFTTTPTRAAAQLFSDALRWSIGPPLLRSIALRRVGSGSSEHLAGWSPKSASSRYNRVPG